jgi:hypothetical protein
LSSGFISEELIELSPDVEELIPLFSAIKDTIYNRGRDLARYDSYVAAACLNGITIFSPIGAHETYQGAGASVRTGIYRLLVRRTRCIGMLAEHAIIACLGL